MITNRKVYHDFEIKEEITAGMVLKSGELKAIQEGKVSLKESFVSINGKEVFLKNATFIIPDYITFDRPDAKRDKKLLLTKKQINYLKKEVEQDGFTLVPIKIVKLRNKFKLIIGLAKGLKKYDKRQKLKEKTQKREIQRALKEHR